MRKEIYLLLLIIFFVCGGCTKESTGQDSDFSSEVKEITLENITDDKWTYFSLVTGQIIGTSELLNTEEDALWADRLDWDIAICGENIRTNGGTSGKGQGCLQYISNRSFNAIEEAPSSDYLIDQADVIIRK